MKTYLLKALTEAEKGLGICAPNPAVGAVLVKDDHIISAGYHTGFGKPHAEAEVLKGLSDAQAQGAHLYVTLEPCCHWGKTPPCVDLIIEKKIAKVVYGFTDPNPMVCGKSAEILKRHNIACELMELPEIQRFYRAYARWQQMRLPWVSAKIAISLDGKIAASGYQRTAITSAAANRYTHQQRKNSDAILTSAQTIIYDDPQLNVRLAEQTLARPVFIIDQHLRLPLTARVLESASRVTVFYNAGLQSEKLIPLQQRGVCCIPIPEKNGFLDLQNIFAYVGEQGMHHLWIEAGSQLTQALINMGLLQRLLIYVAPKILGSQAISGFNEGFDFSHAENICWHVFGSDALCEISWSSSNIPQG